MGYYEHIVHTTVGCACALSGPPTPPTTKTRFAPARVLQCLHTTLACALRAPPTKKKKKKKIKSKKKTGWVSRPRFVQDLLKFGISPLLYKLLKSYLAHLSTFNRTFWERLVGTHLQVFRRVHLCKIVGTHNQTRCLQPLGVTLRACALQPLNRCSATETNKLQFYLLCLE